MVGYGHVGDGNMHLNITTPQYSQEVMDGIEPFLYEWTSSHRSDIFRGFHLLNMHGYRYGHLYRVLVLDEIDHLDSKGQEVLYTMFEWPSLLKSRLLLIGKTDVHILTRFQVTVIH